MATRNRFFFNAKIFELISGLRMIHHHHHHHHHWVSDQLSAVLFSIGSHFLSIFHYDQFDISAFFSYHYYIRSICWMYWFHFSGFLCNLSRLLLKQFIDSACLASLGRWFMTRYEKNCLRFRKPCPCLAGNQFKHFSLKKKYLFLVAT